MGRFEGGGWVGKKKERRNNAWFSWSLVLGVGRWVGERVELLLLCVWISSLLLLANNSGWFVSSLVFLFLLRFLHTYGLSPPPPPPPPPPYPSTQCTSRKGTTPSHPAHKNSINQKTLSTTHPPHPPSLRTQPVHKRPAFLHPIVQHIGSMIIQPSSSSTSSSSSSYPPTHPPTFPPTPSLTQDSNPHVRAC